MEELKDLLCRLYITEALDLLHFQVTFIPTFSIITEALRCVFPKFYVVPHCSIDYKEIALSVWIILLSFRGKYINRVAIEEQENLALIWPGQGVGRPERPAAPVTMEQEKIKKTGCALQVGAPQIHVWVRFGFVVMSDYKSILPRSNPKLRSWPGQKNSRLWLNTM